MADLKQELAQIQGRLAALKKDCLAKMGEHGGDAVINAGSAVARKLKARPARKLGGHFGKAMSLDFAEGGIMSSVGQDGLLLVWDTWKGCRKAQPITLSSGRISFSRERHRGASRSTVTGHHDEPNDGSHAWLAGAAHAA